MRWQIATEDVGSTGPEMCGLACRRAARGQFQDVARSKSWVVAAGITAQAGKQASKAGRHNGRLAKSMSLSLLHASSRVRGCGGGSGRVGQGETRQVNLTAGRQSRRADGHSRSIFSSAFVPGSR